MSSEKTSKPLTVMLDAEITEALKEMHTSVAQRIAAMEMEGVIAPPTMGHLARTMLRRSFGLPEVSGEDLYRP